jgi:hypothetical protein
MTLLDDLITSIKEDANIKKILVGAHWTVVQSMCCGMASTVMGNKPHAVERVRDAGDLHKKSAKHLAIYAMSEYPLEACIGLAAINSLIKIDEEKLQKVNAFEVLTVKGKGKTVAVFGHFPHIDQIKSSAERVMVFELNPTGDELRFDQVPELLPFADVVGITSNSIINHTLDDILAYLKPEAFSVMVGPSTPLSPVLFDRGLDLLAGVRIINPKQLFHSVGQGSVFQQVRGVELVTLSK